MEQSFKFFFQAVGVCASAYTLAVIAVERYYAICRPLQSRNWRTKRRAVLTISLVWIFSFVCNIGTLFIFDSVPYRNQWTCDTYGGPLIDFIYQLYVTLVLLFIPLCVMVGLYGHVIYSLSTVVVTDNPTVQQSLQQNGAQQLSSSAISEWLFDALLNNPSINVGNFKEKILIAKKKVTRMLLTIVAAFAVCWLPNFLWWLLVRASDLAGVPMWHSGLNMFLTVLTYISSTTNPITYCFMNKSFRSSILSHCTKKKRPVSGIIDYFVPKEKLFHPVFLR
ncbi:7 transmembrane receptor [Dictyocaulus viviparus]|uniref:7 transmembrane receptor n=1 Tax=Dictyocaulus viviparus TaxID=29172 RepID=A0A0D8YEY9_DICVI|nr:7 transmembrane receptor [Dictyocaulus viviparus]